MSAYLCECRQGGQLNFLFTMTKEEMLFSGSIKFDYDDVKDELLVSFELEGKSYVKISPEECRRVVAASNLNQGKIRDHVLDLSWWENNKTRFLLYLADQRDLLERARAGGWEHTLAKDYKPKRCPHCNGEIYE